ncbi:hypothetical protein ACFY7C_25065 [Streptomyces sp. NPDC012769]|uniref:hypothetical protein n=1 Tax=Streptomyces sp. NPDC012769 TaxID=3364848 RepID=UPI0036CCDD84
MPTYQEIMQTDLGKLSTAADGWKSMAEKLKKVEDLYEKEVQSVATKNPLWTGQAQQFSAQNFQITRNELDASQKEALAMESLLRDAHGTFTELKGRVKAAVDEAIAAGMKVSESGSASYDFSKVSAKEAYTIRHDPDLREVEMSYTRKINDAVKAVTDFDADVKVALLNASGADGTAPFGFNSKPVNDVEAVEALALSEKVREGKASKEELEHYRDLLKQNSDDKHFSEAYLNGLGAKDTLTIADRMNLAANERGIPADQKKLYESIQAGLADTIASGTKDPNSYAYRPFVDGLKEFGDKNVTKDTGPFGDNVPTQGYQVLVTLMSQGNPDGYGKEFLNELGHDMIEIEKKEPNQWQHFRDVHRPNIAADPLDGLLNIMSKDPADAEYFLDPKAPGNENDHLKFLLTDREWPKEGMNNIYGPPQFMDDPSKATGLGAAIQAAATGQEPGSKPGEVGAHTEGQARVMHHAVKYLDSEMNGDKFPENLTNIQKPMAHALADYVADTHVVLGGQEAKYGGINGNDDITGSGDNAHIAVGQGSLVRVMRGISDDSEAYALLYEAERHYAAGELASAPPYNGDKTHGSSAEWNDRGRDIGAAMGALNGIGADVYRDKTNDKVEWAEDTAEYSANGVNSVVGEIPIAGSAAGAIVDTIKYDWVKDVTDAAEEQGKKDASSNYARGMEGTNRIFDAWGEKNGIYGDGAWKEAKNSANDGYDAGRNAATAHLQHGS